jgi:multidrug efflux system membrane fusion protein
VVEAWDRTNKQKLSEGSLLSLDNQIDATTGTIKLKARFNNQDDALFPNQFVNARMLVATEERGGDPDRRAADGQRRQLCLGAER